MVKVRVVCISDTHNAAPGEGYKLPAGDVLIHAGDLTNQGSYKEIEKAARWLSEADFEVKLIVAGNHDLLLDQDYCMQHGMDEDEARACKAMMESISGATYLEHSRTTVRLASSGVSFGVFGSPMSRADSDHDWAFQYAPDKQDVWDVIQGESIIITHMPPAGYGLDSSNHWTRGGCQALSRALQRTKPLLHVCGHCHEGRGARVLRWTNETESGDAMAVETWADPGDGSKKQSRLDLRSIRTDSTTTTTTVATTAAVNASIRAQSWTRRGGKKGPRIYNKPIVVDLDL